MKVDRVYDSEDHVSADGLNAGTRLTQPGTILIVVRGMILAQSFPVAEVMVPVSFNQDLKALVPKPGVEGRFLYYWLRANEHEIKGLADEAAHGTKRLQSDRLFSRIVHLPPVPIQRRITSILSTYDDLIENNTRRIAILDEMARALYREWFVEFRFPGHMKVPTVESAVGQILRGWSASTIAENTTYLNRGIPPIYDDTAPEIVINQKCIRDGRLNLGPARRQSKAVPAEKNVRLGDVLVNSTGVGTLGRVAQVLEDPPVPCTVDSHVTIVRPGRSMASDFFGMLLLSLESYFAEQGVGATGQTELSRDRVGQASLVVPPEALQADFTRIVRPIRQQALTLEKKNANLRASRDLLLPRLVSGEVNVADLVSQESRAGKPRS